MSERKEKKSERLEIRLPYSKKEAFIEACEQQSDTPSNAVRRFINSYIRRSNTDDLKFSLGVLWRNWFRPVPVALTAAVLLSGAWALTQIEPAQTSPKTQSFAQFDKDDSGELTMSELNLDARSFDLLLFALDKDQSKGLSIEEFQLKGTIGLNFHDSGESLETKTAVSMSNIVGTKLLHYNLTAPTSNVSLWGADDDNFSYSPDFAIFIDINKMPEVFQK